MATQTVVTIAHLTANSADDRVVLLHLLHIVAENAATKEASVLKFAICLPDTQPPNQPDATSVYVFEEHLSHNTHPPLAPFLALNPQLEIAKVLDSTQTKSYHVAWLSDAILSRDERLPSMTPSGSSSEAQLPYVFFATITDPRKEDIDILAPYGAAIVKWSQQNEPDTIFYADALPTSNDSTVGFICALEVYATKAAALAHLKDATVNDLTTEGANLKSKFELVGLEMYDGWLVRA